jgi:hypothetical protein
MKPRSTSRQESASGLARSNSSSLRCRHPKRSLTPIRLSKVARLSEACDPYVSPCGSLHPRGTHQLARLGEPCDSLNTRKVARLSEACWHIGFDRWTGLGRQRHGLKMVMRDSPRWNEAGDALTTLPLGLSMQRRGKMSAHNPKKSQSMPRLLRGSRPNAVVPRYGKANGEQRSSPTCP